MSNELSHNQLRHLRDKKLPGESKRITEVTNENRNNVETTNEADKTPTEIFWPRSDVHEELEDDAKSSNKVDDDDKDGELFNTHNARDAVLIIQCQMRKRMATIRFNAYKRERATQNVARVIQCQIRRFLVTMKDILLRDNNEDHRENDAV